MIKSTFVVVIFLVIIVGMILPTFQIDFIDHTAFARCPNGSHKSPSGDCEKYVPHKGLPRCPNGSHRSPDGDCEKVSDSDSSSSSDSDNNDNNHKSSSKSATDSGSGSSETTNSLNPTLPGPTSSEGIEISGPVTYVVDGDTLDVNSIRIRLALVNTPEVGELGFDTAKKFVENLCLGSNGEVDIDDGQRQGSFGRQIGVIYCDGVNLNSELMSKGYAVISSEFCDVSEFSGEPWAKSSCQTGINDENGNNSPIISNQESSSLSTKQEQQVPLILDSPESDGAQTEDGGGTTALQPYSNSNLGISLKHPKDWSVANLKNGIQLIKEKNGVYVEIRKHDLESPAVELKQYVGDDIKDRSSSRQDFKLLNITQTTISGNLPAYKAIYTFLKTENQKDFATEETTNKISRTWTVTDGNVYLVAYVADEDNYGLYLPVAEKIIDTLKINPESQQSFSDSNSNDNGKNSNSNDNGKNSNSNDNGKNSNSNDNGKNSNSKDGNDGGDKDCSDFDKKNFRVQPGDPYHLDRDGDGIACEG
jgi:endonuclease YncB( thermonuclease family)